MRVVSPQRALNVCSNACDCSLWGAETAFHKPADGGHLPCSVSIASCYTLQDASVYISHEQERPLTRVPDACGHSTHFET
jgi:hypothetical protein